MDPKSRESREVAALAAPARRSPRAWIVLLTVVIIGLTADLVSKDLAFERVADAPVDLVYDDVVSGSAMIPWHQGIEVVPPDLLDFRLVLNRGAVFGVGQGRRGVFVVFTLAAIAVALGVFGWWTRSDALLAHIAIGLVLAGGLGNLYDRVAIGAVRDFLYLFPRRELPLGLSWPGGTTEIFPWVFNLADVELLVGMGLLLIQVHLSDRRQRREGLASRKQVSDVEPAGD